MPFVPAFYEGTEFAFEGNVLVTICSEKVSGKEKIDFGDGLKGEVHVKDGRAVCEVPEVKVRNLEAIQRVYDAVFVIVKKKKKDLKPHARFRGFVTMKKQGVTFTAPETEADEPESPETTETQA
jgi:hypothetical protein